MPDKKPALEGWRKMGLGLLLIAGGFYIGISGDWSIGWKLIALGVTVFFGGNVVDRLTTKK